MDNIDIKIQEILSKELKPHQSYESTIISTLNSLENKKYFKSKNWKLTFATVCCSLFLITGIVFAKDIEKIVKNKFNLGFGINTAIENGYISKSESDFEEKNIIAINSCSNEVLTHIFTKVKLESVVMTDTNIGIEFIFEFDSNLNNYVDLGKIVNGNIDYENSHHIEFEDFFIIDEEKNIIYIAPNGEENCVNYFKENNLDYTKYKKYDSGMSCSWGEINTENSDTIKLSLECTINSNNLPNSEKLYISFKNFKMIPKLGNNNGNEIKFIVPENWLFEIDLLEEMSKRIDDEYIVIDSGNKDFEVYEALSTNTGFEFGLIISNIKKPIYPEKLKQREEEIMNSHTEATSYSISKDGITQYYGDMEYTNLWENYYKQVYLIKTNGINYKVPWLEKTEGCYILNSNGEKFISHGREKSWETFLENEQYKYHVTFDMTKQDSTDEITVVIDFKDKPIYIKLKRK